MVEATIVDLPNLSILKLTIIDLEISKYEIKSLIKVLIKVNIENSSYI